MGSYAFITIAGYPIESTKNDFYEWYFRKSERRIVKCKRSERNKLIWGSLDAGDADEIEENYIYDTAASALRRRLELAGYTRSTLEREFAEALAQRLAYAEDYAARHNDCRHHIPLLQSASLDQWLGKLRQIIEQQLPVDRWNSRPPTGDLLMDMLLRPAPYIEHQDDVVTFELFFPCMTLESFALAVLEVVPNDAKCVLDITDLVQGGWTEAFDDLIEYSQEFTDFYDVFRKAIADIRSLAFSLPGNPILARLLHANAITAMETYLADTVKKNVLNRQALLRRFVQSYPEFAEKKFPVAQVFTVHDQIKMWTRAALNEITFHNMAKTMRIYESVFSVKFPEEELPELFRAVQRRHDIIHRNGRDISGRVIDVTAGDLEGVIDLVTRTMTAIDKQIKDGLIDHEDSDRD